MKYKSKITAYVYKADLMEHAQDFKDSALIDRHTSKSAEDCELWFENEYGNSEDYIATFDPLQS